MDVSDVNWKAVAEFLQNIVRRSRQTGGLFFTVLCWTSMA